MSPFFTPPSAFHPPKEGCPPTTFASGWPSSSNLTCTAAHRTLARRRWDDFRAPALLPDRGAGRDTAPAARRTRDMSRLEEDEPRQSADVGRERLRWIWREGAEKARARACGALEKCDGSRFSVVEKKRQTCFETQTKRVVKVPSPGYCTASYTSPASILSPPIHMVWVVCWGPRSEAPPPARVGLSGRENGPPGSETLAN
jgi:hypothetical protein